MLNNIRKITFLMLILGGFALSSCGSLKVEEAISNDADEANAALSKHSENGELPFSVDTVTAREDIWLGDKSSKVLDGDPLPARFEHDNGITLIASRQVNFIEISEQITSLTGIPVKIDDMILSSVREDLSSASSSEDSSTATRSKYGMDLNYTGKLSKLLDNMASRFNVGWRYKNGTIEFFGMETRVFMVYALPISTTLNASIGGSTSTSGTSGGTGATSSGSAATSMTATADTALWAQIEESIKGMLPEGSVMSVAPAQGSVTVTATPYTLRKVGKFIREMNEKLSRQVAISVRVLQLTMEESEHYGLDLSLLFKNANWNILAQGPFNAGALDRMSGASFTLIDPSSKFKGTKAIVEALSKKGKVSVVTSSTITTLNNKVAPVQIARTQKYVESMTSTQNTADIPPTVTVQQDTLNLGFTMEILPRILDHGRIMMMFSMTISDLLKLETFEFGASTDSSGKTTAANMVQQPTVETRGFVQEIAMKSGATLVLSGFEKTENKSDKQGIGFAENLIGGDQQSSRTRSVLVILVTPEVLTSPLAPETRVSGM